ncbi:MAG: FlgD immunoglobulin-like domain containing protein, partial [Chitinophagaceae bacterium]
MDFLNNVVPEGYIVVARGNVPSVSPIPPAYADVWRSYTTIFGSGNSLYHIFKNQGFATIDSFNRPRTWIFVYKKNGQGSLAPSYSMTETIYDNLAQTVNIKTSDTLGYVESPLYGIAKQWHTIKINGSALPDLPGADSARLNLIGVNMAGQETTLMTNLNPDLGSFDISSVSAVNYPYLKLKLYVKDKINYTPYQLKYWRIVFDPVPEGAIAPNLFLQAKDTLEAGEPYTFKVAFKNVSHIPFDSVKVKMLLTDKNNVINIIPVSKKRPLTVVGTPNDTIQIAATLNTSIFPGNNTLYIEANPDNDQPEQFHFNNFAYKNLYVKLDSLNPLLDVTFDGVHILNRDIVSSKPDIIVKLKDEAPWLVLNDTSLVTLRVRFPNGVIRRYYFNNDTLQFTPAGQAPNPDNTATLNFRPYFAEDGDYELIVTGKDRSNNKAGDIEYRVIFSVINKPMISNMLNYPNPFTTSTAFVFTITGNEVPQNIKIEIMTITGKIVREITKEELGSLHIGRNITDFKWDGTDQYGQKLANGIYLYRVVTNLNGKALDKYKAEGDKTDQYFNKGYGKMYLMR